MLAWIASLLSGVAPRRRHLRQRRREMSLNTIALLIKQLVLLRAAELHPRRKRRLVFFKHGRDLHRRHFMRSVYGSRLRGALRHRDLLTRVAILADALQHLDLLAKRFAKRLRRGLGRLWAIAPAPTPPMLIPAPPATTLALADTS